MPETATEAMAETAPTELVPETPAEGQTAHTSHDMTLLSPAGLPAAAPDRMGSEVLAGEVKDGVREFHLTASPIAWPITDNVTVTAWAYNGQVPGPMLRVKPGEKIRVVFTNNLPEDTTIHWHGLDVPIEMDGVPGISQPPVPPGGTFTYEFTVNNQPGTFFYHTHVAPDKQQALGLYGAFIVEPPAPLPHDYTFMLGEWTVKDGGNLPAMPMEGMFPNFFTINGKAWPATQPLQAKVGETLRLRLIGSGSFSHPIHLHGAPFTLVATDGHDVPEAARLVKDTIEVAPGERYDLEWTPTRPGTWVLHCHINHHTMNDGKETDGMGGMVIAIEVAP
jgi:FtsP/CotA-like multicopper oxidase with cupredoxin domain